MKKILVLGAGLVARPLVRYLLNHKEFSVILADKVLTKTEKIIEKHPNGTALELDVDNTSELAKLVQKCDVVVSLLPWMMHEKVARVCIEYNKNLVTTSYVKPGLRALESEVKKRGLLFLKEIGVDPGVDHMIAMKAIDKIHSDNGKVVSFYSYGTSLPAYESNNNPIGYKFSWSPIGFLLVALNDGRYMENNQIIDISEKNLFEEYFLKSIPGVGFFEAFVNRDATHYIDLYGIHSAESIFRGSLRHIGFCETWHYFKKLGLLDREICFDFKTNSPRQVLAKLIKSDGKNLLRDISCFLNIPEYSLTIKKLEWLGLISDELLPLGNTSVFEMFGHVLQNHLNYEEDEKDMLILHQEIIAEYPGKTRQKILSTLVSKGDPFGDSATAYTVSLPAAIAVKLILEKKIGLTGIQIPIHPQIYEPVLEELNRLNINVVERYVDI
ncbi:MAG TPA: saccharopine dehydrogenase C-terminal domain-containing protein [Pseudobacteroides sp.]|uniref:saccharopine dehydrogenase C-terminal domain-containing protein n=1 Tax=Pseudobacteroides sp. TaxID=1968840 RepID=UPI002F920B42